MVDLLAPEFSRLQTVSKLGNVIESCDTETAGHHERFRRLGSAFDSKNEELKF